MRNLEAVIQNSLPWWDRTVTLSAHLQALHLSLSGDWRMEKYKDEAPLLLLPAVSTGMSKLDRMALYVLTSHRLIHIWMAMAPHFPHWEGDTAITKFEHVPAERTIRAFFGRTTPFEMHYLHKHAALADRFCRLGEILTQCWGNQAKLREIQAHATSS